MAAIFHEKALAAYGSLVTQLQRHNRTTIVLTTILVGSLGFIPTVYRDYRAFMSYGPGGPPYNVFGWLFTSLILQPLSSEVLSTTVYEQDEDKSTWLPAEGIAARAGDRPVIGRHVVPQRQLNQFPDKEVREKLVAAFDELYHRHHDILKVAPSGLERHTDSLFLGDNVPSTPIAEGLKREISHIHGTSDSSVHVTLSPADCKTVIEAGWGQRHPLDGSKALKPLIGFLLPKQYVLIYAPRNDEEIKTVMKIVKASVGYMTRSDKLKEL